MRLVLLRHGRTGANEGRLYCGASDVPLSDGGRGQLLELKRKLQYPDIAGLKRITSGMRRTDETLWLLFGEKPDARIEDLREMNFGRFEMHSYEELKNDADYQAWIMDEAGEVPTPGGESSCMFRRRIFAAVDAIAFDALIVCHGGVIAALMARWFEDEGLNMYQWQPEFGQGYEVIFTSDGPSYRLIRWLEE